MPDPQIRKLLKPCPNVSTGCFGSDPSKLESMIYMDDAGIRRSYERAAFAATDAGQNDLPFDEVTFTSIVVQPPRLVDGPEVPITRFADADPQSTDAELYQIAKCGYACGAAVLGTCPVLTPQPE